MKKCVKCNQEKENGSLVAHWGAVYFFCDDCPVEHIASLEGQEQKENWVLKNIREAKERREDGKSAWS